jgi:PucR family transcriptional regulator, purine catabolism regulatory protein
VYPTLAEVLELPVLRAAAPRVRAGSAGLDVRVRWVHVSEQRDPAGTLSGGELVLSIGVAVSDPTGDPAAYVAALRDAGAVGLVVELGQHVRSLPTALVQAARAAEFPLVELTRAVRYVEVTEIVHARILNSQYARMQFLQRVHDTFRTLTVESGELSRVLTEAAALTGLPVVLEDLGHRALSFAGHPAAALLKDWTARSRQVPATTPPAASGPEGWLTAPVGPRSRRWGRLVIPRRVVGGDAVEEVSAVLTHAADALTIGRLLGDDSLGLELQAQGELLQDLLHGTTLDEPALRARARALGLPTGSPLTVVVVETTAADPHDQEVLEAAVAAARTLQAAAIVGRLAPGRVAVLAAARRARKDDARFPERIIELLPGESVVTAAAAGPVTAFANLAAALAEAGFVVDVVTATQPRGPLRVWRSSDLGVRGLLWQLRADPRLQAFVDAQLAPLLRLDGRMRTQMLETLLAYLEADGGMTGFAAKIGLSRPAAYARLARLRQALHDDLDDPQTRLSLHLAMLALNQDRDSGSAVPGRPERSSHSPNA